MISMLQPLLVGNAIRVFIEPPAGAKSWRVLKKASDTFTGEADTSAVVVYEGDEKVFIDSAVASTPNGIRLYYKAYYQTALNVWVPSASNSAIPAAIYEETTTDVQSIVRERLEAFLKTECDRGNFLTDIGYIQVYTAPPSLEQNLLFPLVTIMLDHEIPAERGIGECIGDEFDNFGFSWMDTDGWIADVQLQITGWSLNSDERIELRKALRRFVLANLPIFDSHGMTLVSLSQQDVDALNGEFGVPMYQTMGAFTCQAPVQIGGKVGAISTVISGSSNNG